MSARTSKVSVVLFRINLRGEDSLILLRHAKWGDWSLVGGHIELGETPLDAAVRETEEELAPLRAGLDFAIVTEPLATLSWGPVESKSAGRAPTTYSAWVFCGELLRPPSDFVRSIADAELAAVALRHLDVNDWPGGVTNVLARIVEARVSLTSVPLAWREPVSARELPSLPPVADPRAAAGPRRARA